MMSASQPQLAARMIVATLDGDTHVQQLVAAEVAQSGSWPKFAGALAALAATVCREIDDPEDGRALWLHSVAARL
jgi:hypothetical protein